MTNYIPADKLIAEIKRRIEEYNIQSLRGAELADILSIITSLQQDQPMTDSTKLIKLWHEDKEMLKEKDFRDDPWRLAYNAFMCGFGRGLAVKKKQSDFPTTDDQIKEFLATHPEIKVPEKYKNPDWLFKKQEQPEVDLEK